MRFGTTDGQTWYWSPDYAVESFDVDRRYSKAVRATKYDTKRPPIGHPSGTPDYFLVDVTQIVWWDAS